MPLLGAVLFSLWAFGLGQLTLEQPEISVSRPKDKSAHISCKVSSKNFNEEYIYWYRQKPDQGLEHLTFVVSGVSAPVSFGGKRNKLEASKNSLTSTSTLKINFLEKEDEAVYYCACWIRNYDQKVFGDGTKLVITDKTFHSDNFPKPTIFLPSIAEINLHKVGTHLCLLEKFFPDVIKIYWKEKDRDTVLESQQGRTMKNNDTYMKFSWLTVTAKSMDKEHKCIVKHENNKGGVDQEILFPSIKKALRVLKPSHYTTRELPLSFLVEATAADGSTACVEDKRGTLQLQLTNTSAYYTYLLLLFKSGVYFAIIAFCLFRRTAVCGNGKS